MTSLGVVPTLGGETAAAKVRATRNLVIIVNVLGYNNRTFYPAGDDLE